MISTSEKVGIIRHIPVLKEEAIGFLKIHKSGTYFDGTLGQGGHSSEIIKLISKDGRLIAVDRDADAVNFCNENLFLKNDNFYGIKDSYHNINKILEKLNIKSVDGILLDLGLSSYQLDKSNRGFSYNDDCDLDMRFDKEQKITAKDILNFSDTNELANIIFNYGEERRSRVIAKNITQIRPINKVSELVKAITISTPPKYRKKSIARVFQAIRISVNKELEILNTFLSSFHDYLKVGGVITIISFHSLEDRLVKQAFKRLENDSLISIITKKPLTPSFDERKMNKRSRSSKLRVAMRISN